MSEREDSDACKQDDFRPTPPRPAETAGGTPTPRTDEASWNRADGREHVNADFARQLEREWDAAIQAAASFAKERDAAEERSARERHGRIHWYNEWEIQNTKRINAESELNAMHQKLAATAEAMKRDWHHTHDCRKIIQNDLPCTCGRNEAIEKASQQ